MGLKRMLETEATDGVVNCAQPSPKAKERQANKKIVKAFGAAMAIMNGFSFEEFQIERKVSPLHIGATR